MKVKPLKIKPIRIKPIKLNFNLDSDRDGVVDRKDCQPFNPKKQHFDIQRAVEKGETIEYMKPDEYIRRTGMRRKEDPEAFDNYFREYYDLEKEESRPISEPVSYTHLRAHET